MKEKLLNNERHPSMRGWFAWEIYNQMLSNDDIWVVTGDLGYKMWDRVRDDFPDRFVNVGGAEQALIGVGVGLAQSGKIPILYSITPFLLYRPFETIRNYVDHERVAVKLVGSGRNKDYAHDGFSHWAMEDRLLMVILRNIEARWPDRREEIPELVYEMIMTPKPFYVNLRR